MDRAAGDLQWMKDWWIVHFGLAEERSQLDLVSNRINKRTLRMAGSKILTSAEI